MAIGSEAVTCSCGILEGCCATKGFRCCCLPRIAVVRDNEESHDTGMRVHYSQDRGSVWQEGSFLFWHPPGEMGTYSFESSEGRLAEVMTLER